MDWWKDVAGHGVVVKQKKRMKTERRRLESRVVWWFRLAKGMLWEKETPSEKEEGGFFADGVSALVMNSKQSTSGQKSLVVNHKVDTI